MRNILYLAALALIAVVAVLAGWTPLEAGALVLAMPVVQATYSATIDEAYAGMPGTMRDYDDVTKINEDEDGIGFGLAVGRGSGDNGCSLGGTVPQFLGATLRDITLVALEGENADEYATGANVGVRTQGEIWVQVTGTPGPGDPVHFNATTGVFAASGGSGPVLGARWSKTSANGLGLLYLPGYGQATS